jgi:hypothetical protein
MVGMEVACLVRGEQGQLCAGLQACEQDGLGPCEPALTERCNGLDDDCDGPVDEGFADAAGRYVTDTDCGACGRPCVPMGEHTRASCVPDPTAEGGGRCEVSCEPGFVDADGLLVNGCECRLMSGIGLVVGGDADCDGEVDEAPEFIFVAQTGDDDNDGSDFRRPLRTIQRGVERAQQTGRAVLVARGIYDGPVELAPGLALLGGYSPDFRERDVLLHPVVIERPTEDSQAGPGEPVLSCHGVSETTLMDGFTVRAGDAQQPGAGSTAVYLDRCGDQVILSNITVIAGRGAPGRPGQDSSETLDRWGLASLAQLSGVDAESGLAGGLRLSTCVTLPGGGGGDKTCPRGQVSGGDGGAAVCPDLTTECVNGSSLACGNAGCTDFTTGGVCDLEAALDAAEPSSTPAEAGQGAGGGAPGALTYASPTNRDTCNFCDDNPTLLRNGDAGEDGEPGDDGGAGAGCGMAERLDLDSGRLSAGDGEGGADGADGSGGGGATAGAGYAVIGNTSGAGSLCTDVSGGSGGGGGSGGCGAPGATGGQGGGSSVGILVRLGDGQQSGPGFDGVRVVTASGGDGGDGGVGAAGGGGGTGGLGGASRFWCARNGGRGGDGGSGGAGGGGGGGCGGGSFGLVLVGEPSDDYRQSVDRGARVERAGVAGRGGSGGFSPGNSGQAGADGQAVDLLTPSG